MMKRKAWLLIGALIAAVGILFVVMYDRVSVNASSVALAEQGWRASFSSAIDPAAIERGDLYLTDVEGEKVDVDMTLHENGKTVVIPQISSGEYTLHIKNSAVRGSFLKSLAVNEISFSVQEEIDRLAGEEELKAYFARLLELQKNNREYGIFSSEGSVTTEESADSATGEGGGSGDHSTTNNQVAGVDEADLVKTDGSHIYSISESRVVVTDAENPDSLSVAAELTFQEEMYPQQLFLTDNTLVVLGSKFVAGPADSHLQSHSMGLGTTSVHLYDVSDPSSPELVREFGTEGNLNGARLANNTLYFVTNVYPDLWMMEEQEDMELRPHTFDSAAGGQFTPMPYEDIAILPGTMEGSYSVISAINLSEPQQNEIVTKGFLGGSEQLYMTAENLYLTASSYMPAEEQGDAETAMWIPQQANTEIFKFALEGTTVRFLASNEVTGALLNQFSMDEYNGYFRVVTTEGFVWDETAPSKNHLFILDGGMELVGSVEDLAPGERIYSARFIEDKAYMVTFKEVDPLFVIDISSPSAPEVLGELKIPGFSNYLHPLEDDHLIGFGYDTKLEPVKDGEPRVVTGGMKISLFDVSDYANPVEKDTEIIGGLGTSSPLQYDHKALFTHPENHLFGFPISVYEESDGSYVEFEAEGVMIYTITPEGISEAADLLTATDAPYENWQTSVQRIIYIGDTFYTIANSEVKSYELETFELIDTLRFQ
ncbi:beta-propeller domain-containing protein [Planococcus salinus]|uniref:Copper amine oxidase-like N-terminal domain-containing protein n=1 Tax=Planococcus salinus TaxID=1848460 RepID=A0A3M8PA44_9BACL|nr:beta-propeller domain-containing protein [Planococcus salinus]RNF40110.1 hypothetical protein EEX84_05595 [Planococcus salinus]